LVADGVGVLQKQELPRQASLLPPPDEQHDHQSRQDMGIPAQPSRRTLAPPMAATTDGGGVSLTSLVINRLRIHLCALKHRHHNAYQMPCSDSNGCLLTWLHLRKCMSGILVLVRLSPLQMLSLTPETKVPGVLIFSLRAVPLAGWMSGLG